MNLTTASPPPQAPALRERVVVTVIFVIPTNGHYEEYARVSLPRWNSGQHFMLPTKKVTNPKVRAALTSGYSFSALATLSATNPEQLQLADFEDSVPCPQC